MEQKLDMEHRMTAVEDRSKSNTLRLNKLEENTAVLNRLATAVEVMATKQDTMGESVERLEGKVDSLETKPAKRWEGLLDKMLLVVAGAFLAWLLSCSDRCKRIFYGAIKQTLSLDNAWIYFGLLDNRWRTSGKLIKSAV